MKSHKTISFLLFIIIFFSLTSYGITKVSGFESLEYHFYAPEWIWQGRDINILGVFENKSDAETEISLELLLPESKEGHFLFEGEKVKHIKIYPHDKIRTAFVNIRAKEGSPFQEYNFEIKINSQEITKTIRLPIKTIRGAVVNPGLWAIWLPVGLILIWCIVIVFTLPRYSKKGEWKRSSNPFNPSTEIEKWIKE